MGLYFDKVKVLSYDHTPTFFGAGLRYRIEKKLTITAHLLTLSNSQGVGPIITKQQLALLSAVDYTDIILEGVNFGKGIINNVRFPAGNWVRRQEITYDITCYEDGILFNALDGVYAGIDWTSPRLIDNLTEDFNYSEDEEGNKQYSHNVSVRYRKSPSTSNNLNIAKVVADNLFSATTGLGAFLFEQIDKTNIKRYYTETYNLIDNSCSFSESVSIPKYHVDGNDYSNTFAYNIELNEDGFVTIVENGHVEGLNSTPIVAASTAYNSLKSGAYGRANAVYASYNFSSETLKTSPVVKAVTIDRFRGIIDFSTTFSNNPKYTNIAIHEYTIEGNVNSEGIITVTESGSVSGIGRSLINKYQNALSYYNSNVKNAINGRLDDLYSSMHGQHTLRTVASSFTKNEYNGTIRYSRTRTDDLLYNENDDIRRIDVESNLQNPVHLITKSNVFNIAEIVQTQKTSTLGKLSITINLKGKRTTIFQTFKTAAIDLITDEKARIGAGEDDYLESCQITFNPNESSFSMSASYVFSGIFKSLTSLTID